MLGAPLVDPDWAGPTNRPWHRPNPWPDHCSREVACQSGTTLQHSLKGGVYLNGCFTDDRYDPTMGYDAHLTGEICGPPGDVGYWKMKGGASWHWPWTLLRMMVFGVPVDEEAAAATSSNEDESGIIGMTLHSSINADRFYIGGPGQLRGFLPAGIGPRATK
eukprot:scaffold385955_cov73-Cyclotella_meneghiniana.AAC.1